MSRFEGRKPLRNALGARIVWHIGIALWFLLSSLRFVLAQPPERPQGALFLVRLPASVSLEEAGAYLKSLGLAALNPIPRLHVWRTRPLPGKEASLRVWQEALGSRVMWIEEDGYAYAQEIIPNDPDLAKQWNVSLIDLPRAWMWSRGEGQTIAIIDSGVDLEHPDLQAKMWWNPGEIAGNGMDDDGNGYTDDALGWDFVDDDAFPFDAYGHGTHVAGIAGAHTDNGLGVAGVGWEARLMALRVLNASGMGLWSDVAEAIVYAADNGARVLNLSLGGPFESQTVADAVAYAQAKGCLVVAAAGNNPYQPSPVLFPARLEEVVAVAATDPLDAPWALGNRGPEVDIAAPGVAIYSTVPMEEGAYGTISGTSMATPHVSGLAALLWAYEPDLTAAQVTYFITSTAQDVYTAGWDERTGWGRVDAYAALWRVALPQHGYRLVFPLIFRGKSSPRGSPLGD